VTQVVDALALSLLPDANPRLLRALCGRAPAAQILASPERHADLLSPCALAAVRSGEVQGRAQREIAAAERRGYALVTLDDARYPPLLRATHDPPLVLYVWGTLVDGEGPRSVAIVGARAGTPHGRTLARALGRGLAEAGLTVVSGLARGVDSEAHLGALDAAGRTVAVLGSGLACLYPRENAALAEAIARKGAVVSEFPLEAPPHKQNFPRRNRVIAGWTPAVVVVEAGQRSGALVTARLALDEGRDVYAVPGHPATESAMGTNQLIRDGAALVRDTRDVLEELGIDAAPRPAPIAGADPLLRLMNRDTPCSLDELQSQSGLAPALLLTRLTELELESRVRRVPGSLYVRN
jgi:DNA processing protein